MANLGKELESIVKRKEAELAYKRARAEQDIERHGGTGAFQAALRQGEIIAPEHPDFDKVYRLYGSIFTLTTEREKPKGFRKVLELNSDRELAAKYGPIQEKWIFLKHPSRSSVVGASNFDVYGFDNKEAGTHGTQHVIYALSHPDYRNQGIGGLLLKLTNNATEKFLREHTEKHDPKFRVFNEQNNPLRMTVEEYQKDTENAGIDQCDRLRFWQKRGHKPLDFGYIQPPLEAGADPCAYLTLNIIAEDGKPVPASLVFGHLLRFADFTVLKRTRDPTTDPSFVAMAKELKSNNYVGVSNPDYAKLKQAIYGLNVRPGDGGKPLVELIKPELLREAGYKVK